MDQRGPGPNSTLKNLIYLNSAVGIIAVVSTLVFWYLGMGTLPIVLGTVLIFVSLSTALLLKKGGNNDSAIHELQHKLNTKETLLKEVHHRVKNNLQTVSSLLSLQSRAVADEKIEGIIKGSQHRVVSMSMVHEMLYKRDDYTSRVQLGPYVNDLCDYLIRSLKGSQHQIVSKLDLGQHELSIDTVIPLGLIINEVITNALKYGIKDDAKGEITIELDKIKNNGYQLYLGDNGVGLPVGFNFEKSNSLGMKLIHNLSRQLRGNVTMDTQRKGTFYKIDFQEVIDEMNWIEQDKKLEQISP